MPGTAKTSAFQFSTATIMIGPMSAGFGLNAKDHGIGLTKNVQVSEDTGFVELTQGVTNTVVASMVNKMTVKVSAEIYEMTSRNLTYGLGLDATDPSEFQAIPATYNLEAAVAASATTFVIPSDVSTDFVAGTWGFLQEGLDDTVHFFKVVSSAYAAPNTTVTMAQAIPTSSAGFSTANGRAGLLNKIDANPEAMNNYFGVQIVGVDATTKKPVGIHMPKVKITKGFAMNFSAENFGNLPFEFEPMIPVPTDPGYSADFPFMMSSFTPN